MATTNRTVVTTAVHQTAPEITETISVFKLNQTVVDVFAGSVAGMAGKFVEFPFDTIKVRLQCQSMQSQIHYKGTVDCLIKTLRMEGPKGLYKGFATPMFGSILENAVLFFCYGQIQKVIKGDSEAPLTISQLSLSGALAGTVISFILTPVELVKCKLQIQRTAEERVYKGPIDCFRKIISQQGLGGLYKGHAATAARETAGGAAWFGVFEMACRLMSPDGKKDSLGPIGLMSAGALGGIGYNAVLFPVDVVKSQIQVENSLNKRSYLTRFSTIYKTEGMRGLYRGFGITLCRAVPANAVIFGAYELSSRFIKRLTDS